MGRKANDLVQVYTIGIALCGALIFSVLRMPLPWMLGPLFAVAAWKLTSGRSLTWPSKLRQGALVIFGYMLGISFTNQAALVMLNQLPFMISTTVLLVIFSLTLGIVIAKRIETGLTSSLFGSIPGGLSQVLMVSEEVETLDKTTVTLMQSIRATAVVFLVPFITIHGLSEPSPSSFSGLSNIDHEILPISNYLFYFVAVIMGVWGGKILRLPARYLTGPLLTTAVLSACGIPSPHVSTVLIIIAQLSLGIHLGIQIQKIDHARKLLFYTVASSLLIVLFSLFLAFLLTKWTTMDLQTAFLSTAPGGIAEMGLTASLVHANMSLVSGYQLFRIFFIMFLVIPLLQLWIRRINDKKDREVAS